MKELAISALVGLTAAITCPAALRAEGADICIAEGPYHTEGAAARVGIEAVEPAVVASHHHARAARVGPGDKIGGGRDPASGCELPRRAPGP